MTSICSPNARPEKNSRTNYLERKQYTCWKIILPSLFAPENFSTLVWLLQPESYDCQSRRLLEVSSALCIWRCKDSKESPISKCNAYVFAFFNNRAAWALSLLLFWQPATSERLPAPLERSVEKRTQRTPHDRLARLRKMVR